MAAQGIVELRGWPARSPDLNPIENLWGILQTKVSDCGPRDREELIVFLRREWLALSQPFIDELVRDFQRRVERCIARTVATPCSRRCLSGERPVGAYAAEADAESSSRVALPIADAQGKDARCQIDEETPFKTLDLTVSALPFVAVGDRFEGNRVDTRYSRRQTR